MAERILIVEDHPDMAYGLMLNLRFEGYEVEVAYDCGSAFHHLRTTTPDLVLLDLMLPDMPGFDFLRSIREEGHAFPVIILSARGDEVDRVAGLRLGAQDYVTKPFSVAELLERVRIRIRSRDLGVEKRSVLRDGALAVDLRRQSASVGDVALELTPKELALLAEFLRERGRALSRNELLARVWATAVDIETRTVDFHVMRLRAKLKRHGYGRRLQTVSKFGYVWD